MSSRNAFAFRFIASVVNVCFIFSYIFPTISHGQIVSQVGSRNGLDRSLPAPGTMINLSPAYVPVIAKGLRVHPDNPILFDFIVDTGNSGLDVRNGHDRSLREESTKLIKYFLAALTIPDNDQWVNLSPYEKDRIIPDALGQTEMGRDMLAQDYILKQLTASLIYPEKELGKEFWAKVYAKAQALYGSAEVPVNTFNKVWIVADQAKVYVHDNTAFVVASHLKVMLEEDYISMAKHNVETPFMASKDGDAINRVSTVNDVHTLGSQIIREIVLPALETEVNSGKNFANLRQIFHSMILATWYKKNLKEALLNQVYSNKSKINGVDVADKTVKDQIYQQYLKAYKKGVFNYIKEDINQATKQTTPRKYFSGGLAMGVNAAMAVVSRNDPEVPAAGENLVAGSGVIVEMMVANTFDDKNKNFAGVTDPLSLGVDGSGGVEESILYNPWSSATKKTDAAMTGGEPSKVQRFRAGAGVVTVTSTFTRAKDGKGEGNTVHKIDSTVPQLIPIGGFTEAGNQIEDEPRKILNRRTDQGNDAMTAEENITATVLPAAMTTTAMAANIKKTELVGGGFIYLDLANQMLLPSSLKPLSETAIPDRTIQYLLTLPIMQGYDDSVFHQKTWDQLNQWLVDRIKEAPRSTFFQTLEKLRGTEKSALQAYVDLLEGDGDSAEEVWGATNGSGTGLLMFDEWKSFVREVLRRTGVLAKDTVKQSPNPNSPMTRPASNMAMTVPFSIAQPSLLAIVRTLNGDPARDWKTIGNTAGLLPFVGSTGWDEFCQKLGTRYSISNVKERLKGLTIKNKDGQRVNEPDAAMTSGRDMTVPSGDNLGVTLNEDGRWMVTVRRGGLADSTVWLMREGLNISAYEKESGEPIPLPLGKHKDIYVSDEVIFDAIRTNDNHVILTNITNQVMTIDVTLSGEKVVHQNGEILIPLNRPQLFTIGYRQATVLYRENALIVTEEGDTTTVVISDDPAARLGVLATFQGFDFYWYTASELRARNHSQGPLYYKDAAMVDVRFDQSLGKGGEISIEPNQPLFLSAGTDTMEVILKGNVIVINVSGHKTTIPLIGDGDETIISGQVYASHGITINLTGNGYLYLKNTNDTPIRYQDRTITRKAYDFMAFINRQGIGVEFSGNGEEESRILLKNNSAKINFADPANRFQERFGLLSVKETDEEELRFEPRVQAEIIHRLIEADRQFVQTMPMRKEASSSPAMSTSAAEVDTLDPDHSIEISKGTIRTFVTSSGGNRSFYTVSCTNSGNVQVLLDGKHANPKFLNKSGQKQRYSLIEVTRTPIGATVKNIFKETLILGYLMTTFAPKEHIDLSKGYTTFMTTADSFLLRYDQSGELYLYRGMNSPNQLLASGSNQVIIDDDLTVIRLPNGDVRVINTSGKSLGVTPVATEQPADAAMANSSEEFEKFEPSKWVTLYPKDSIIFSRNKESGSHALVHLTKMQKICIYDAQGNPIDPKLAKRDFGIEIGIRGGRIEVSNSTSRNLYLKEYQGIDGILNQGQELRLQIGEKATFSNKEGVLRTIFYKSLEQIEVSGADGQPIHTVDFTRQAVLNDYPMVVSVRNGVVIVRSSGPEQIFVKRDDMAMTVSFSIAPPSLLAIVRTLNGDPAKDWKTIDSTVVLLPFLGEATSWDSFCTILERQYSIPNVKERLKHLVIMDKDKGGKRINEPDAAMDAVRWSENIFMHPGQSLTFFFEGEENHLFVVSVGDDYTQIFESGREREMPRNLTYPANPLGGDSFYDQKRGFRVQYDDYGYLIVDGHQGQALKSRSPQEGDPGYSELTAFKTPQFDETLRFPPIGPGQEMKVFPGRNLTFSVNGQVYSVYVSSLGVTVYGEGRNLLLGYLQSWDSFRNKDISISRTSDARGYVRNPHSKNKITVRSSKPGDPGYPQESAALNKTMTSAGKPAAADAAMKAPGGIDLNSKNLQLDVNGQKIDIKFNPAMVAQFKRGDFSGVHPVILNITPIASIRPLLGLKEDETELAKV